MVAGRVITTAAIVRERLRNQSLVGAPFQRPEAALRWLGAMQSQDYPGARWALGQRTEGLTSRAIDQQFNEGTLLRTHVMRPTWHFVARADIRWLLELTGPRVHAVNAYWYRKFELDGKVLRKCQDVLAKAVQGGNHLTRTELAAMLEAAGVTASGLRLGYILMYAELNAVVCSGAMKGKQHTYALLDERVPMAKRFSREEALAELARRYYTSHGPARVGDFAWWSGLTVADAKAAHTYAGKDLVHDGELCRSHKSPAAGEVRNTVHLLPNYDEYLIAYKDRGDYAQAFTVPPPVGVFDRHLLIVNGKVAGAWRVTAQGKTTVITIVALVSIGRAEEKAIDRAVGRYSQFLETPVSWQV